jgi:hypothetical protein
MNIGSWDLLLEEFIVFLSISTMGCDIDDVNNFPSERIEAEVISMNVFLDDVVDGFDLLISLWRSEHRTRKGTITQHICGIDYTFSTFSPFFTILIFVFEDSDISRTRERTVRNHVVWIILTFSMSSPFITVFMMIHEILFTTHDEQESCEQQTLEHFA